MLEPLVSLTLLLNLVLLVLLLVLVIRDLSRSVRQLEVSTPSIASEHVGENPRKLTGESQTLRQVLTEIQALRGAFEKLQTDKQPPPPTETSVSDGDLTERLGNNRDSVLFDRENSTCAETEALCSLYNAAVDSDIERERFMECYKPVRIGVINASARRADRFLPPCFKNATNGDYYAVRLEHRESYFVLPRFGLTFESRSYESAAMGTVFDCPGYEVGVRYRNIKVVEPALFEADPDGSWNLKQPGRLNLGPGY